MKALVFLALALCVSAKVGTVRHRARETARSEARISAGVNSWLEYNYGFANTFKEAGIRAKVFTEQDWPKIGKVLAIRGARMEAAIGIAAQSASGMTDALKKTINNIICSAKVAFPSENEAVVLGRLFALPGAETAAAEKAWVEAPVNKDNKHPDKWIDFDASRSGCFLSKNDGVAAHITNVKRVLATGNYRELLHLLARMSLYGEWDAITDPATCEKYAPGSFRHAMIKLHAEDYKVGKVAAKQCEFNLKHLQLKWDFWGQGKGLLQPTKLSSVNDARGANKAFRGSRDKSVPKLSVLNANAVKALAMPPVSAEESKFFAEHGKSGNDLTWTSGGNFLKVPRNDINGKWFDAMVDDGLMIDAGPSGTTDEACQFGDFASVTLTKAGACAFRASLFANMIVQVHHSYPEIVQGAFDSVRAAPAWSFEHPYQTLEDCGDGLYAEALKRNKQLLKPDGLAAALGASDFGKMGKEPRPNDGYPNFPTRVFSVADEGEDGKVFNDLVCKKGQQYTKLWAKELSEIYCVA